MDIEKVSVLLISTNLCTLKRVSGMLNVVDLYGMYKGLYRYRKQKTSQGGRMSRAPGSHSGRLGNLKVAGSNLDFTVFKPSLSQTNDFKIDTCHSVAWHY